MRKIAVVTGTRAEYGILQPLLQALGGDSQIELQLLVTGMHLLPEFGMTVNQIEKDGFKITKKIDMKLTDDSKSGTAKSVGIGLSLFAEAYEELCPDILVVLGDRSELMSAAVPAVLMNIPIAHISGGDVTEGAFDDSIRHALTKFASLHFTTTETYRKRVIQMGEDPSKVFNTGSMSIDQIFSLPLLDIAQISQSLEMDISSGYILATFHPETRAQDTVGDYKQVLKALENFIPAKKIVFTYPNSDPKSREFIAMTNDFVSRNAAHAKAFASLGTELYLSVAKHAAVVVGNSSSGVTEVPSLKTPTVNIGNRQKGRLAADSVLHSTASKKEIVEKIGLAISDDFRNVTQKIVNPYGDGRSTARILEVLKSVSLNNLANKKFFDIQT